jgi:hypothetical protein
VSSEQATAIANLPAVIKPANANPFTPAACLALLERSANIAVGASFQSVGAAIIWIHSVTSFAPSKAERKTIKEIRAILGKAFGEQQNANLNARSTRFKYAKLSLDIACHKSMREIVMQAAKLDSLEAGVAYVVKYFLENARSVADLTRHFGPERPEAPGVMGEQAEESQEDFFLRRLAALVKKTKTVPFTASVELLAPAATQQEKLKLLRKLVLQAPDQAIPELRELFAWFTRMRCEQSTMLTHGAT